MSSAYRCSNCQTLVADGEGHRCPTSSPDIVARLQLSASQRAAMLTIVAEPALGGGIVEDLIPAMRTLAANTGARVKVVTNDTQFWAYPWDTDAELVDAVARLYPRSAIVATHIQRSVPRMPSVSTPPANCLPVGARVTWTRFRDDLTPYEAVGEVIIADRVGVIVREDETGECDSMVHGHARRVTTPEVGAAAPAGAERG